jgi:hypothetical protein
MSTPTDRLMSGPTDRPIDEDLHRLARLLRQRAASLRAQARDLTPPLAAAYRRRASELELEAWVADVQAGAPVASGSPSTDAQPVLHPAA